MSYIKKDFPSKIVKLDKNNEIVLHCMYSPVHEHYFHINTKIVLKNKKYHANLAIMLNNKEWKINWSWSYIRIDNDSLQTKITKTALEKIKKLFIDLVTNIPKEDMEWFKKQALTTWLENSISLAEHNILSYKQGILELECDIIEHKNLLKTV